MAPKHVTQTFAALVRAQMALRGLALVEVARRMGASPQALVRILTRDNPHVSTVQRVARALSVDPRELVP